MLYGSRYPHPSGAFSTELADVDFETYSEAGYRWDEERQKWVSTGAAGKAGLMAVGLQAYAEHPTAEILCMWYDLKDGRGPRVWIPGLPFPEDFKQHIADGKLVAAWNSGFEERIWRLVGMLKYGFPELPPEQIRCDMAKARAHCLPGGLDKAGAALKLPPDSQKMKEGKQLIRRFCIPRTPTKKDARRRIRLMEDEKGPQFHAYCKQDIATEANVSRLVPDLNPIELAYWQVDQQCNRRGVRMDEVTIDAIITVLSEVYADADRRMAFLTHHTIRSASEVQKIMSFLAALGVSMSSLDADAVDAMIDARPPEPALEILRLRKAVSSAAVKKVFTMRRMLSRAGRLHDLFVYHSARTGRDAGADAQPQNLPGGGPHVSQCVGCGTYHNNVVCPSCGRGAFDAKPAEWNVDAMEQAIELIRAHDLNGLRARYGDPVEAISGCLRGLFIADEGHDFIATDYSSIEAVVAAALAGEQWRLDTFARKEDIYLASVAKIKGRTLQEYAAHKAETGMHHPDRKVGKVAELASGFGGWVGAWRAFGAEDVFSTEKELKDAILAWRAESPAIVEMWGGQFRGPHWDKKPELYGLEGAAIAAVTHPGQTFGYRAITYQTVDDVLYCTLPSGRKIAYHEPRLTPDPDRGGVTLSFMGYNTNPKMGAIGWVRLKTYGGKLFENVVQATARDILVNAAINCEARGYAVILRVHDELVTQQPEGQGSVEELEAICGDLPHWAKGWPVRAAGGWRGKRYRKE